MLVGVVVRRHSGKTAVLICLVKLLFQAVCLSDCHSIKQLFDLVTATRHSDKQLFYAVC